MKQNKREDKANKTLEEDKGMEDGADKVKQDTREEEKDEEEQEHDHVEEEEVEVLSDDSEEDLLLLRGDGDEQKEAQTQKEDEEPHRKRKRLDPEVEDAQDPILKLNQNFEETQFGSSQCKYF